MSGVLGKYKIAVDTSVLGNGDSLASYLVASGALLTSTLVGGKQRLDVMSSAEYAEDSAHVSGDYGQFMLAVRSDSDVALTSADGDYSPIAVDQYGRLKTVTDLDVDFDFVYAEDSAHVSGDLGAFVLAVRQDALASSTSADGDYAALKQTSLGELYVHDVNANASLDAIEADVDALLLEIQALSHAEDVAHVSGDAGIMALAVRKDANGAAAADGDYHSLLIDEVGDLKVNDRMNGANLQQLQTITTIAAALPAAPLSGRKHLVIQNVGSSPIFLGSATVTASGATRGIEVPKGGFWEGDIGPANVVYGICASGTVDVVLWEIS